MRSTRIGIIMVLAGLLVGMIGLTALGHGTEVQCYTHTGSNDHGKITNNGRAVTLNPYQPSWPGDHFHNLRIRNVNGTWGDVIANPESGVAYFAPDHQNASKAKVKEWKICKYQSPPTTTSTSTTSTTIATTTTTEPTTTTTAPTTTTTQPTTTTTVETTTTTVGDTTTTIIVETTTTTVEDTTTTTVVDETTTTVVVEDTTTTAPELPFTGIEDSFPWIGLVLLAGGAMILGLTRRPEVE